MTAAPSEPQPVEPHLVVPRSAATVVLIRPGAAGVDVLLTSRPSSMAFAADAHVFPGGRVDVDDAEPSLLSRAGVGATDREIAAIRELFEEAGVLLATGGSAEDRRGARSRLVRGETTFRAVAEALDLRLHTEALVPLSRWVTPAGMPRRFDARFFVAELPADAEVTIEGGEVVEAAWFTPRAALDAMSRGELSMWLPTSSTLQQLEYVRSIDDVRSRLAPGSPSQVVVDEVTQSIVRIEMPSGGGVDGQPINGYLVGDSAGFVLVDPGDPTGPGLDRAVAEARRRNGSIEAICLTQCSPDHAAGAEALREQLGVPVFVGPGGGHDLPYPTTEIDGGTVLEWLEVIATPGPSPEHLAFVVDGRSVLSGDLDGPRGARSILGPTDEAAWRASNGRLRAKAPDARWFGGHPR